MMDVLCNVYECAWGSGSGCVLCQHDKTRTTDQNDLKLGTVVVLDTVAAWWFWFQKVKSQGHRIIISIWRFWDFLHNFWTDEATCCKFCTLIVYVKHFVWGWIIYPSWLESRDPCWNFYNFGMVKDRNVTFGKYIAHNKY